MDDTRERREFPNNLTAVCRLCLTGNEKLHQLFRSDEIEASAVSLSMKVMLCTAIRMSKLDVLPQKVCQSCVDFVNEWYKFRKKCVTNDHYLKKFLSHSETQQMEGAESDKKMKHSCSDLTRDANRNGNEGEILGQEDQRKPLVNQLDEIHSRKSLTDKEKAVAANFDVPLVQDELNKLESFNSPNEPVIKKRNKKFKCTFCPDSFYYVKDLKLHNSVVHKPGRSERSVIEDSANAQKDEPLKPEDVGVRARYEMKCCEKIFLSKAKFRKHYNKKHPGEKPYMCETCGKKDFISEETLKRHKILHTGKYRCDICSKTFTCNAILTIHKRDKHENDKPFICDVCGKRFVTELLMNYHKRFHTGEKKYVCEECGLAVVTSSSLAKHKRIHSNVKPHVCQVCGKGFIVKGRLVEHLRVHTGERPYSCHVCHKGFTMRDKLKRHVRIHSGEKHFSCEYCGNNYSTSYGLTLHLKSHIVRNY